MIQHPILGPVTKDVMEAAHAALVKRTGKKACKWCHAEIPKGPKRAWCSDQCVEEYRTLVDWKWVCEQVFERDKGICRLCGRYCFDHRWGRRTYDVDHIKPRSLGGTNELSNLRTLCLQCHKDETARLRREKFAFVAREAQIAV